MLDSLGALISLHLYAPETILPTMRQHVPNEAGDCRGCISPHHARSDRCIFREAAEKALARLESRYRGVPYYKGAVEATRADGLAA